MHAEPAASDWQALRQGGCEAVPPSWLRFCLGELEIGWLAPQRVGAVRAVLEDCRVQGRRLIWNAQALSPARRSQRIQGAALRLRDLGLIPGWRGEAFACEAPGGAETPLFELERAAFRCFGLQSRAVHIHGFTPDGQLWCGRRAADKATDPGLLDNLAAGGLSAGEKPLACALRELQEEAGLAVSAAELVLVGDLLSQRQVTEGWHEERLTVFQLELPAGCEPRNQDGEVSEFLCLSPAQALARCQRGEFTNDAALAMAEAMVFSG